MFIIIEAFYYSETFYSIDIEGVLGLKILVGMSGGVDSSVSASLLLEKGYEVIGVTLKLVESSNEDFISDAKEVAKILGIEHHVLDLRKEFSEKVEDYFAKEYLEGRTPNPCAMCNPTIKFGLMLDYALSLGCSHLATGHYAKIIYDENINKWLLKKSDNFKDQSYFLYKLNQFQLSHAIFPLSEFEKTEVRNIAEKYNLPVAKKSESQDICFVKNETHAQFIERYKSITVPSGNFLDTSGNTLGKHKGIINYTVGQRRHLGIALGEHMYVKKIDSKTNSIILGNKESGKTNCLLAWDLNLISIDSIPKEGLKAFAKIRSRANEIECKIYPGEKIKVVFSENIYFPAPGQSIVFYDEKGFVIGGGVIC